MLVLRYFAHSGHCVLCYVRICVPFSCFQQWVFSRGFLACFPLRSRTPVPPQACAWHSSICATCTLCLWRIFLFVLEYFPLFPIYVSSRKFWILCGIKQSLHRPGQALRDSGRWGHPFSAYKGSKIVSGTHPPPLLISVNGWVDPRSTVRPEGIRQWKIPVTPLEIEPAPFRLVGQCLFSCAVPSCFG